jgi:hypothetical protein
VQLAREVGHRPVEGLGPNRAWSRPSIQQKACSLSVDPIGMKPPSGSRFTPLSWPLCAKVQRRPHNSRENGWVFSRLTRPRLALRTWATTIRLLIGMSRRSRASCERALGSGSWKLRQVRPS